MFDVTKPEQPSPVLFFIDKAEILRDYEAFTVEAVTVRTQAGAEAPAWSIVAKHRFTPNRGPVAQFNVELYANIFRDMCELRSRGIVGPVPWSVRFAYAPVRIDTATGKAGPRLPALMCAVQDARNKIVGVQLVFLDREGRKAQMANPKLSLGQTRGCALRLGEIARHVVLVEGPEDGLTLRQRHPGASVWVALGTGGLPFVELPPEVEAVTLAGDNNAPGRRAIEAAAEEYQRQGRRVRAVFPDERFEDWNDELRGIARQTRHDAAQDAETNVKAAL